MKGKTTKFILGIILPAMLVLSLGLVAAAPVSAAALTSVTVTPTDDAAGATTTHTIDFTTATELPKSGKMRFAFLTGFDVSGATLGSVSGPDGGFTLTKSGQVITVTRNGLGTAFAAGDVTVVLNNIVNHETAGNAYTVDVDTTDSFEVRIDGATTSATFEIVAADLDALVVVADPTDTVAGATISTVTVRAEDEFENIIKTADVDIDVALNKGAFNAGSTMTETTDASGIATFDDLAIETADTGYVMRFSDDDTGLITEDSDAFKVTPDALDTLTITNEPTDPTTAGEAIGSVTVEALDQFDNPIEDVAVTVTEVGHTYTFNHGTLVQDTDASGIATFGDLVIDTANTNYQLHFAAAGPKTDDSVLFDVVAADLDTLTIQAQPSDIVAGAAIGPVTVKAQDEFLNVIEDIDVDVALSKWAFASGTYTQTTNASGIATFDDLLITTVDTGYTMTFSSGAIDSAPSDAFKVTPDALDTLTIQVQPTQTVAGDAISPAVTVLALDKWGNEIPSVDVDVTEVGAYVIDHGTFKQTTDASGIATFNDLVIDTADTDYQLHFASGVKSVNSDLFDVVALTSLVMVDQPTDTVAGQVIQGTSPVTVQALDTLDSPISGIVVGVTLNKNAFASGTTPQTTDVDGIATFDDLVINTAATGYKMTFASGAVNVDSDLFDVEAAAVKTLTVEVQPTHAEAGAVIAPSVQVKAVDEFSNLIGGLDIDVTLLVGTGTLSGTTPKATATNGIATFNNLSINLPGVKQLQFAADGLTKNSAQFDVGTISVALSEGWNLMSSPLIPNDPDIEAVLADIEADVTSVWYYDPTIEDPAARWLLYAPGFNSLTTIEDGKAYWINMEHAATLWIDGIEIPLPPGLPPVYEVVTGWNMVGFKSTADMSAADYLNAMAGKYTRVYGFDKGAWFAIAPPYAGDMEPGLGYWVSFTDGGAIYP